ncbi:hypothetical protein EJ02DRAFT_439251 [Clathrospora elynae]|uniref:Gfd2/YDR514C-like C-terminal domain-containing protein n=1 Tax=Clathrospora elynae TaxID=706981 RepID=A0A6A5S435_9PLEO|nr:hypothetical protein EJ02DRAFT_439251 [Clathrospora elynae]
MAVSTTAKLKSLRDLLAAKPHQDVLRLYLQSHDTGLLQHAFLVTVHRKWSAHSPYHLTELGITTYDRMRVNRGQPIMVGPHAEDLLRKVWSFHLILRPHAHLDFTTGSSLAAFHFGTTIYVSQEEALDLLHQIWHQPMDEADLTKGMRPIVYMSFDDNDGLAKMRKAAFDFTPSSLSSTVAVLDAQNIPVQAKITRSQTASYDYLLKQFKITAFDVGNSGNAAMYATIIAILSALRFEIYGSNGNKVSKPGRTGQSSSKAAHSVVQSLMEWPTPPPPWGVTTYCWRCGIGEHRYEECPNTDLTAALMPLSTPRP